MNQMAVGFARRSDPRWVRENVVIQHHTQGSSIECRCCGGPVLTQAELANVLGVKLSQLQSFLHRRTVRPDVVAKIRAGVLAVRDK
jgi:hypothetical protein